MRVRPRALVAAAVVLVAATLTACGGGGHPSPSRRAIPRTAPPPAHAPGPMVAWRGPVEHLFFHPPLSTPGRAFHSWQGRGFRDYFVTVGEFNRILRQLYSRRWVLVDIEAVAHRRLRVPKGRRPLIISVDDLNYYDYLRQVNPTYRLMLDRTGRVAVELRDRAGHHPRLSRTADIVPILDDFVAAHPDFSVDGAKAVIAETGYQGTLGWRTNQLSAPDIAARRAGARRVATAMKAEGWRFASHSWGHINETTRPIASLRFDSIRWRDQVESIVGKTDLYVYPFGAQPSAAGRAMLHREFGFRVFCGIDVTPELRFTDGMVLMARRHIDGLAFDGQRRNLRPFFTVSAVRDGKARRL